MNNQNNALIESENSYELVLQALSCLKTIKSKFADLELSENNNTLITNDFKLLLFGIFNSDKKFLKNLIKTYNDKAKNINEALLKDPYHFIKYFIQFLNEENIPAENPNYFQTYTQEKEKEKRNSSKIISLFKEYYKNTQASIIADNIFFSEIILIQCDKCFDATFDSSLNQILELDVDKFIKMKKEKYPENNDLITLNRCLQYEFLKESKTLCTICKDNNATKSKVIINNSKVLIIYLKRNEHKGVNDIKINEEIDLSKFNYNSKQNDKFYSKYILKSYISFKTGNENKYFVDYCVSRKNNISSWFRYDKEYKQIQQNELFDSEPILLFYETTEKGKKNIQNSVQAKASQDIKINTNNSISYRNSINGINHNNMTYNMENRGGIINNTNNNMEMMNNNNNQVNSNRINYINNNMGMNYMNNHMGMNNNIRMMNNNFRPMNNNIGMINNNNINNNIGMINNNNINNNMGMINSNNFNNNMGMINNNNINNNMGMNYMNNNMGMNYMNNNIGMNNNNNGMMNQMNAIAQNQFLYNNQFAFNSNSINTQSSSPSNTNIYQNLINNSNDNNEEMYNNPNIDNITIICVLVSEDNKEDELTKIHMQIKGDEKVKDILQKYLSKLQRDDSVVKKFLFNDNELSKTSEQTASEINLTNNSVIKGIKDASYYNNNNNNANNNNNNVNDNNNGNNNNNIPNNNANEININDDDEESNDNSHDDVED